MTSSGSRMTEEALEFARRVSRSCPGAGRTVFRGDWFLLGDDIGGASSLRSTPLLSRSLTTQESPSFESVMFREDILDLGRCQDQTLGSGYVWEKQSVHAWLSGWSCTKWRHRCILSHGMRNHEEISVYWGLELPLVVELRCVSRIVEQVERIGWRQRGKNTSVIEEIERSESVKRPTYMHWRLIVMEWARGMEWLEVTALVTINTTSFLSAKLGNLSIFEHEILENIVLNFPLQPVLQMFLVMRNSTDVECGEQPAQHRHFCHLSHVPIQRYIGFRDAGVFN